MIIAPQAEADDGYFDLVLIEDMKKFEIIRNSRHLYAGTIAKNPKVIILKARNIKVQSQEEVYTEYDGEMGEKLPAEFSIVEKALNFRI
jgi:diacylglycerol kinase family enzyme